MSSKVMVFSVAIGMSALVAVSQAAPVGSAFTYQGQLKFNGTPVTDTADVRFTLYDADVAGNVVGSTLFFDGQTSDPAPIDVVKGLFSASLDFGTGAFDDQARWLQVEVRSPHDPTDVAPYTPLNPRQEITPTPFALKTRGINVATNGNVGIGTMTPKAKLHIGGRIAGAFRPWMDNGVIVASDSDGGYFGVKDEGPNRQDTVIAWGDDTDDALRFINTRTGGVANGTEAMRLAGNGNVGIGTTNPSVRLEVNGTIIGSMYRSHTRLRLKTHFVASLRYR